MQTDRFRSDREGRGRSNPRADTKKIFVGGLATGTTQAQLTAFFAEHGKVENVIMVFDRETNRPRGFGFVTFASGEPVAKLCKLHFIELHGKMVEIKAAQPAASGRRGPRRCNRGSACLYMLNDACTYAHTAADRVAAAAAGVARDSMALIVLERADRHINLGLFDEALEMYGNFDIILDHL